MPGFGVTATGALSGMPPGVSLVSELVLPVAAATRLVFGANLPKVTAPFASFAFVTALFLIFFAVTAFALSCFAPTLFLGIFVAAKAAPPRTTKTAIDDITFA